MEYKDFSFDLSEYGSCKEYSGSSAVINAIKNILLSRPGNFPFTPKLGMDIGKYNFELLDDYTISTIKTDLLQQINEYIPSIDSLSITVNKVEDEINGEQVNAIGIGISALDNGTELESNFLIIKDKEVVSIYNETR